MGATEWYACTRWQSDPRKALDATQREVLAQVRRRRGKGITIDSLREEQAEDGTGTVIDVFDLSEDREPGFAAPAEAHVLEEAFGTAEPSRDLVDERWSGLAEQLDRGDAVYFEVFEAGEPSEWCFVGCTGDGGDVMQGGRESSSSSSSAAASGAQRSPLYRPSPELAAIIGDEPCDREVALTRFWRYLREKGLYDQDFLKLRPDAATAKVLGSTRTLSGVEGAVLKVGDRVFAHLFPVADAAPPTRSRAKPKLRLVK